MPLRNAARRFLPLAAAIVIGAGLAGCSSSGLSLTQARTQGYDISEDALAQIRPGQSSDLVILVLGSPQTTNNFGDQTAWYYIEEKLQQTSFGMVTSRERTVLAIYFDKNNRVASKTVYGLEDGRVIDIETRRTPSFGEDRTFIQSILSSVMEG
jgi:outer membrane protein assembly factor BamE (lipoprotein component of BamABCDE complex)